MRVEVRKAQKPYRCVVCGGPIEAGESYRYETALPGTDAWDFIVDNKPTSWRRHLEWATCDAVKPKYEPSDDLFGM